MTSDPRDSDPFRPAEPAAGPFEPAPAAVPAAPVPDGPVRSRSSRGGLLVNVLLGIALVVAVGGVAFAAGRATAPSAGAATGTANGRFGNGGGLAGGATASGAPFGGPAGAGGNVSIEGTVTAISADSITLEVPNGQTVTISIDGRTTFDKRASATSADVTSGSTVIVQLQGGRGFLRGNGGGNDGNGNDNGGSTASGQPTQTLPAATSITVVPKAN